VPGDRYRLSDGLRRATGRADAIGKLKVPLPITRGDVVAVSNGSRNVTELHLADLEVHIRGERSVLAGGRCQPGEYYGPPLKRPPESAVAGFPTFAAGGAALTGQICPMSGDAAGLSSSNISQTDERGGGQTRTEVPDIENTSPANGEVVYGPFNALARSGLPGPVHTIVPADSTSKISLVITRASSGRVVDRLRNVDTKNGARVPALKPGSYRATWTLADANGDTRTVTTRFVEEQAKRTRRR
jgi:hypothetical protein